MEVDIDVARIAEDLLKRLHGRREGLEKRSPRLRKEIGWFYDGAIQGVTELYDEIRKAARGAGVERQVHSGETGRAVESSGPRLNADGTEVAITRTRR